MSAVERVEQENIDASIILTELDYKQLQSFQDMLESSIQAAEETLATAKNRYAIFSRMLKRIQEKCGIETAEFRATIPITKIRE